jgi:hypothetical protein
VSTLHVCPITPTDKDTIGKRSISEDVEILSNKKAKFSVDDMESHEIDNNGTLPQRSLENDKARSTMDVNKDIIPFQQESTIDTNPNVNLVENEKRWLWLCSLEELKEHKSKTGSARVTGANKELASWCLRQRTQYRQYLQGIKVPLNEERISALNAVGLSGFRSIRDSHLVRQFGETSGSPPSKAMHQKDDADKCSVSIRCADSNLETPLKEVAQTHTGQIVSPPMPLKDAPVDSGLRDLLVEGGSPPSKTVHQKDDADKCSISIRCADSNLETPLKEVAQTYTGQIVSPPMLLKDAPVDNGLRDLVVEGGSPPSKTVRQKDDADKCSISIRCADSNLETPLKEVAQTYTGQIVSPPMLLKDAPVDNGLRDLLVKGQLQEYFDKFQESGISSLSDLCDKLEDLVFMEKLVTDVGFTASQAIRFQMLAATTAHATTLPCKLN